MNTKTNATIIIDRDKWLLFQMIAKKERTNASQLIREFVDQKLDEKHPDH